MILASAIIFLLIGVFYAILTLLIIPGLAEERLGKLEALPDTIGAWCDDETSPDGVAARQEGLRRQTRLWVDHEFDWLGRERILRQVRYLDRAGRVVKTEREKRIRRRRIRS